jgi:hypothetical protein
VAAKGKKKLRAKARPQVLQDHKWVGKRFIPPLLQYPEDRFLLVSWYRDLLPELLWIAVLCDQQGYKRTVDSALQLGDIVNATITDEDRKRSFALASDYDTLSVNEREQILQKIDDKLKNSLEPCIGTILKFYPQFPMNWLVSDKWMKETTIGLEGLEQVKNAIKPRIDRTSKPAMECQMLAYVMWVKSGKLKLPEFHDPNLISKYPHSEESKKTAAFVRALMKGLLMTFKPNTNWANKFWSHSYEISPCEYPGVSSDEKLSNMVSIERVLETGVQFTAASQEELESLWNKVSVDLAQPTRTNVIGGLLARNLQLACDIVESPSLWVMPIAAILIRCMVDTQIRLQWLMKRGTQKDFEEYVQYGLGQEKLLVEHLKRISKQDRPDRDIILAEIQDREAWINAQLYTILLPVDVGGGSWGKDLRILAEEADMLDLHRLTYSPLSSAVHGHWNMVARLNLTPCQNPLHCDHWLPILPRRVANLSVAIDAVRYYDDCYRSVSLELTGKEMESKAVSDYLEKVEQVFSESQIKHDSLSENMSEYQDGKINGEKT